MIQNFLVFSFLHYFEKNKIMTSSGYNRRELRPIDKPVWTWNDYSWIVGFQMDPKAVDATEEMGGLMDLDCGQPDNTNIVRNARESLEDPVAGGGRGVGMMMALC